MRACEELVYEGQRRGWRECGQLATSTIRLRFSPPMAVCREHAEEHRSFEEQRPSEAKK